MEEVVISAPGYDPASTNVPGYTQEQLQSFIDGTHKGSVPEGAQSKANSWQRVTKVVSIHLALTLGIRMKSIRLLTVTIRCALTGRQLQGERRKMNAG